MVKPPFSERHDPERREEFDRLHEGIPDFLFPSVIDWTLEHFFTGTQNIDQQMILRLERRIRRALPPLAKHDPNALVREFQEDDDLLLDAIDFVLSQESNYGEYASYSTRELDGILEEAGSAYCVGTDEDGNFELQFCQSEEMTDLFQTEADQPGRAAEHLRRAWSKCFHRDGDPNGACDEAVNAVEAVARAVVSPKKAKATLGTMCNEMSDKPEKWETDSAFVGSVETVLHMMRLVWNEGHYRHGDDTLPLEVSQESAEMTGPDGGVAGELVPGGAGTFEAIAPMRRMQSGEHCLR